MAIIKTESDERCMGGHRPVTEVLFPCGCPAKEVRDIGLHQDGCPRGDFYIAHGEPYSPPLRITDGGRRKAGISTKPKGDCVTRAFAVATGRSYLEVRDRIRELARSERRGKKKRGISAPETGVYRGTINRLAITYGMTWTPTMQIGTGTLVHVRPDELPLLGRYVLSLSAHVAAYIDGVLWDNHDSSRGGTRCVYGYWTLPDKEGCANSKDA